MTAGNDKKEKRVFTFRRNVKIFFGFSPNRSLSLQGREGFIMKASVRCNALTMAQLRAQEKHGKRQDMSSQNRRIRNQRFVPMVSFLRKTIRESQGMMSDMSGTTEEPTPEADGPGF